MQVQLILALTVALFASSVGAFDGERPALPSPTYFPGTTYQSLRCPEALGLQLNAMAYVRVNEYGMLEVLQFPLHTWDDWPSPTQYPELRNFAQCWMRPPLDSAGGTSTWCQPITMPDGRVLAPAGTGQIYAWIDGRGKLRVVCDMSCHWPGDLDGGREIE